MHVHTQQIDNKIEMRTSTLFELKEENEQLKQLLQKLRKKILVLIEEETSEFKNTVRRTNQRATARAILTARICACV